MRKLALLLALVAWTASASASLTVTDDGTNFTITSSDAGGGLWEMKMLKTTGNIWSFKDLTDAGNGAGGHYNYLGQDGYNNQRSLLMFDGRDNNITVGGLALATNGSMAYSDIGTGLSSFTCTYTEAVNGNSGTYLYGGTYNAVTNGDVTTQIVVTINDATVAGTVINYSVTNTCHMDPADAMDGRYFATSNPGVSSFLADGRNQAGGNAGPGEGMNITRSIEAGSKWTMATVDASVLNQSADHGLTAGRSFSPGEDQRELHSHLGPGWPGNAVLQRQQHVGHLRPRHRAGRTDRGPVVGEHRRHADRRLLHLRLHRVPGRPGQRVGRRPHDQHRRGT